MENFTTSDQARLPGKRMGLITLIAVEALLGCLVNGSCFAGETVRTGADQVFLEPYFSWIEEKRVGLVTNHTGLTGRLEPLPDLFARNPKIRLAAVFAPEHGIGGAAQAGELIENSPQVFSLYGKHRRPTSEMLKDVEVLVFDMQDVGARFYTYISTMLECMKAAARSGITFIVLDRPNPLSGARLEGPVLEPGLESFVGIVQMPIRHGMTIGELARFFKSETRLELDLRIVPLSGWHRVHWFDQTGLTWIAPSPNMPTLETAVVYPGSCLIEGTNLSEGRGTTQPFQLIGAPWLDSEGLVNELNQLNLPGVHFRPQAFTPTFSKFRGQLCAGIQIHVLERDRFYPVQTLLHVLRLIRIRHPAELKFHESFFDQLAGNRWIRGMLTNGASVESIVERWKIDFEKFKQKRKGFLLY